MSIRSVTHDHRSYHGAIARRKQKKIQFLGGQYRKFRASSCVDKSLDRKFGKIPRQKHLFTS